MQQYQPQNPFFIPVRRNHLTEEELNCPIDVVIVRVWGDYTVRGEHRKEIIVKNYDAELEVPKTFNKGHIKLMANRYIKSQLQGIRARNCNHDEHAEPKPVEHKRKVRDFMSWQGLQDNESLKREYEREMGQRRAEADAQMNGIAPRGVQDDSAYGADGLPRFSERTYVSQ